MLFLVLTLTTRADDDNRKATWIPCVDCLDAQRFDPDDAMASVETGQRVTERLLKRADDDVESACLTNKATLLDSISKLTDEAVDQALALPEDPRAFHPHVTIGRCHRPVRFPRELADVPALGSFAVEEFSLFESTLGPTAVHTPIARFALSNVTQSSP